MSTRTCIRTPFATRLRHLRGIRYERDEFTTERCPRYAEHELHGSDRAGASRGDAARRARDPDGRRSVGLWRWTDREELRTVACLEHADLRKQFYGHGGGRGHDGFAPD